MSKPRNSRRLQLALDMGVFAAVGLFRGRAGFEQARAGDWLAATITMLGSAAFLTTVWAVWRRDARAPVYALVALLLFCLPLPFPDQLFTVWPPATAEIGKMIGAALAVLFLVWICIDLFKARKEGLLT